VIGVNTAIRANAAGIGFAIPIDTAERAVRILAEGKRIPHAYLGISMSTLTEETARQNNAEPNSNVELPVAAGALVLVRVRVRVSLTLTLTLTRCARAQHRREQPRGDGGLPKIRRDHRAQRQGGEVCCRRPGTRRREP